MRVLVFDLETNGLMYQPWTWPKKKRENPPPILDRVHCLCIKEVGVGEVLRYHDDPELPRDGTIAEGLEILLTGDVLVGHNVIRFDLPVLSQLYGWTPRASQVIRDTLVMSHLGYTSLGDKDKRIKSRTLPPSQYGHHSLRAWGYRIGMHKGHVNDTEDWSTLDQEMLDYCARDVVVNERLWVLFNDGWAKRTPDAVQIEHEFFIALETQIEIGWHIDQDKAWALLRKLEHEKAEMEEQLLDLFPPRIVPPSHVLNQEPRPSRKEDPDGWAAWQKWVENPDAARPNKWWNPKPNKTAEKVLPFEPSSAMQVIWNLNNKYGWEPTKFTTKGNPQFGEAVISTLPFPETADLVRYAQVCSRISELVGDSGYLTLLWEDGRLHGNIEHCGAVTHRCTHSKPNMGNVTGVKNRQGKPQLYGKEMRELFTVPSEDYRIVGADASGLELRMLGNRMARYDKGAFAQEVVHGDQHSKNTAIMGLAEWHVPLEGEDPEKYAKRLRSSSKSPIYAHNYGAANLKLGRSVEPAGADWSDDKATKVGAIVRERLLSGLPALKKLVETLKKGWKAGATITGLDGRLAENRAAYQALNTQLQMDGAIVIKWATVIAHREARLRWGPPAKDGMWCMVGHVHDEYQFQVKKEIADEFGELAVRAITEAGLALSVVCRLDGEFKVGLSWADTH